jgi:predicted nucleic acid-binding Zn ribbon protein
MKCPSCGKENPAGEQYCLDCGAELSAAAASATPAPNLQPAGSSLAFSDDEFQRLLAQQAPAPAGPTVCPHCGAAAPQGGQFCDNCGEPLTAPPAVATTPAAPPVPAAATPAPAQPAAPPTPLDHASTPAAAAPASPAASVATDAPAATPATPAATTVEPSPAAAASAPTSAPPAGPSVTLDLAGPTGSSSYMLSGDEAKIGRRDADAGIFPEIDFEGNDFVNEAGEKVHAVSRRHGRIFRDGGDLKFEDLGSTNGSVLDGSPVLPHDPQPLKDGSAIVLGRTCRITVHIQ